MIEILPVRLLTDEDAGIFGALNVSLGKLLRAGLPVEDGMVVTPPDLRLRTILERHNFDTKEVFTQSLTFVKKEIDKIPVPEVLSRETGKHKQFFLNGQKVKTVKNLWLALLNFWLEQIKQRLWMNGFYLGITAGLEPGLVFFIKKLESFGSAFFDPLQDDVVINCKSGSLSANHLGKIADLVKLANKKLFIPHEYEWILDEGVKLTRVLPYTPSIIQQHQDLIVVGSQGTPCKARSAAKVFLDFSDSFAAVPASVVASQHADGVYIASEKIFNLDKPIDSFDQLASRLTESAALFPSSPVLVKLADQSEAGMGKVRGALRLLHQKSLFDPMIKTLDFARHKKGLLNVHIVIPFIRGVSELIQIKRALAAGKLMRKNSLQIWMEIAVPENIINLAGYLEAGLDGIVVNLDELAAYLNGFDHSEEELLFYKEEVDGLIKFLADGMKLLHKSKIPFIAYGSLAFNHKVLEFLVESGVYGVVADRSWVHSAHDLLYQTEKRIVLTHP